jgi:hypothetical protein
MLKVFESTGAVAVFNDVVVATVASMFAEVILFV